MKKSNFLVRTLVGVAYVLVIIFSLLLGSISYFILFLLLSQVTLIEFYLIIKKKRELRPQIYLASIISFLAFGLSFLNAIGYISATLVFIVAPLVMVIFINEVLFFTKRSLSNIAYTILGLVYVTIPFILLNYIVFQGGDNSSIAYFSYLNDDNLFSLTPSSDTMYHPEYLLSIFVLIWIFDTFSYLWGVTTGKHLLIHKVSPKKTWEGFWGGMLSTFLVAFIISKWLTFFSAGQWLVLAFIVVFFGLFGDLTESLLKRSLHIKDSSNFIPGHGGFLDRLDSFLMVIPIYYLFLLLILG